MTDWSDVDMVITHRTTDENGQIRSLVGYVVEEGSPREQSLELSVMQVVNYLSEGGTFFTGKPEEDGISKGGMLELFKKSDEEILLQTAEDTPEPYRLNALPIYQADADSDSDH